MRIFLILSLGLVFGVIYRYGWLGKHVVAGGHRLA